MLNFNLFENTLPDGHGVLEIVNRSDGKRLFVPLGRTELSGEIAGPLGAFVVRQTFSYTREQCAKVLEALYRFPLPGDAAVRGVTVTFGAATIRAVLRERREAEAEYGDAKKKGKQAALLTREAPNVFTLSLAGLKPDEPIVVETRYVQLATSEGSGFGLRVPLTTAPRYVRRDEEGSRVARGEPLAMARDPEHRFSLDLRLPRGAKVASTSHALVRDGDNIRLAEGEVLPDRDFVLTWQPAQEEGRPTLQVWKAPVEDQTYFLALVSPPSRFEPGRGVAREAILLVDHSGSMSGAKWETADWAVEQFLADFSPRDHFALAVFESSTRWHTWGLVYATAENVQQAVDALKDDKESGGTELGIALEQALEIPPETPEAARHMIIFTDAEVSDAGRLIRLVEEQEPATRRRVSVICIDAAPNSLLARELAERSGGLARFLTSSPSESDLTTAMDETLKDWAEPVITGLCLEVPAARVQGAGRREVAATRDGRSGLDLGDLPCGRSVWVVGRYPTGGGRDSDFAALNGRGQIVAVASSAETSAEMAEAIKACFGARQVLELEYLTNSYRMQGEIADRLGAMGLISEPAAKEPLYPENSREKARDMVRPHLVKLALEYGLASAETAFVAVREESGQTVEDTVLVPNAVPAGWEIDAMVVSSAALAGDMPRKARQMAAPSPAKPVAAPPPPSGGGLLTKLIPGKGAGQYLEDVAEMLAGLSPIRGSSVPAAEPKIPAQASVELFRGVPVSVGGETVLFDSTSSTQKEGDRLAGLSRLNRLLAKVDGLSPAEEFLVLIFVDDMSVPRVRVRLADILRVQDGRPLNATLSASSHLRVVLRGAGAAWPGEVGLTIAVR